MLFQHTMSALDQLMTAASSEAGSTVATQSSHDASSKVEKRFAELEKRRAKALYLRTPSGSGVQYGVPELQWAKSIPLSLQLPDAC